ncbi:MAG TPA: hypothetical protein VKI45_11675 [Allosphingosinicella sp.]|nr:hypothetical protein [Allosphingosinicella sp.]
MRGTAFKFAASLAIVSIGVPAAPALAGRKTAKTEVDKAGGKCVAAIIGGAVLGALLGGKRHRGEGIAIGIGAGAAGCAVMMATAKHRDRILAAQREAAQAGWRGVRYAVLTDDNGHGMRLASQTEEAQVSGALIPARYKEGGQKMVSPDMGEGPRQCRRVSSELTGTDGSAKLSPQLFCRTAQGRWEPYATTA